MSQLNEQFELLANYNQQMNQTIYQTCFKLNEFELRKHRGAFFGSIINTLNHILVGDIIWLKRISSNMELKSLSQIDGFETPNSLDKVLFDDFEILNQARSFIDQAFINLTQELNSDSILKKMSYKNSKEEIINKNLRDVLLHVFNHQTHHRGQVSVLLSQVDQDYGCTDLITMTKNI